ncbi:MAG: M20/M25/M40 family metallo-hydrolase [Weeksellaceae bacterium]
MKLKSVLLAVCFPVILFSQEFNQYHQNLVNQVSQANINERLNTFVGFGIKTTGSNAQQNTLNWLAGLYQSWGYDSIEQQSVNIWGQTGYNLIVTKTGTVYPDQYIIIDGHYDTIYGPGANDNGSGTAVILEIARILKDIPTEYSIKFIHFTGEEVGLIGSQAYVQNIVIPQNLDIKLVINIDEVGGVAGMINDTITCERDLSPPDHNNADSNLATTQLANCIEIYSDLNTNFSHAYGSDYVPFQEAGFVITGLYESNESPYPHTQNDTVENMDPEYVYEITKGTLGAVCFFAKAYQGMGVNEQQQSSFEVYPNPVKDAFIIKNRQTDKYWVQLNDLSGKNVFSGWFHEPEIKVNTKDFTPGIYVLNISGNNIHFNQKLIVQP